MHKRMDDPNWTTRGPTQRCWNCGAHVTPRFSRVMGDNDDRVYACPRCAESRTGGDTAEQQRSDAPTDSGTGT